MEIIPEDTIENYHNFCMLETGNQIDKTPESYLITRGALGDFLFAETNHLKGSEQNGIVFQLFYIVVRSYRYYNLKIPDFTKQKIKYIGDIWRQRMRSHRDATKEELIAYVKTEIKQTFLVEYVFRMLNDDVKLPKDADNFFIIEDKELLMKTYPAFFTLIDLIDEEIGKLLPDDGIH